jgi:8-hydroxy-5-deazaflavin:NADPH oxidoreductase
VRIAVIGRGHVGGGLGDLWERAGHEVARIGATNLYGDVPPAGFPSNAEFVKSKANGPTAKAFNLNFAALYPRLGEARARPSDLWCGDAEAREVVEQLSRDAGYDPVCMGPIENASALEAMNEGIDAIGREMGPCVFRIAPPDLL